MGVASDADLNGPGVSKEIVYEPTPFGKEMLKHFAFGPGWKNLNHGIILVPIHNSFLIYF
jgi:hypothetical protein